MSTRSALVFLILSLTMFAPARVQAQSGAAAPPRTEALSLFAIEFKTGPNWDPSKPPQEQAHFQAHSANLKRLREAGSLLLGARYSDKGLIVLAARSLEEARQMIEVDPSVEVQTFVFEAHPFNVFYPGNVQRPGTQ
jgi:uncharacterized protein YciI